MYRLTVILLIFIGFSANSQYHKNVILQDHWTDTSIYVPIDSARFNDIWGFEYNGDNYCAVGTSEGVEILKVDEDGLTWIDNAPATYVGFDVIHRDMKTYGDHLYLVGDEGTSSLQIFDLSFLPDSIQEVYNDDSLIGTSHNIWIDTATAKLYACGPVMWVLDISTPDQPEIIYPYALGYIHDIYVRNDTGFLNMAQFGLLIVDFTDLSQLGVMDFYPNQGYNHSGWWSASGEKYVFIDETQGTKLKLCYVNDPALIQIDETFGTADYLDYLPHNVYITDELAFVSYYNEGLRIFDLTSAPIREVGGYDTHLQDTDFKLNGAWGVYVFEETNQILISDRQSGVFLFSFPIDAFKNGGNETVITNGSLIDENSFLLPKDHLYKEQLRFSIYELSGKLVYDQENYLNWVNIPLSLNAGVYYYGIYDDEGELLESGKFAKAN